MLIQLCNVVDGDNVINKTFDDLVEITIYPRKDFSVINPSLILSSTDTINVNEFNYLIIPELNRHYFIVSSENMGGFIYSLSCDCDVLETYKTDILNSNARFLRNIETGDYINTTINYSTQKVTSRFYSGVDVTDNESMLLTTVGTGVQA